MENEKDNIKSIDSSPYDFRYEEKGFYRNKAGLTAEIVSKLSDDKNDPDWMREFRQNALKIYNELRVPEWGPDIAGLNIEEV